MALGRMKVYVLTELTRKASSQRRVVIQGLDLPARGLIIALLAILPGIAVSAIFFSLLGSYAFLSVPVVEVAVFWLVEGRTRGGLHLRQYQALLDKRKSNEGKFTCCGVVIDPLRGKWGTVVSSLQPNPLLLGRPDGDYLDVLLVTDG